MKLVVDLNISYKKLLVSPKDFVTLTEIFDRSEVVDTGYTEANGSCLIKVERRMLMAEQATKEPITQADYDALREAERLAKENTNELAA